MDRVRASAVYCCRVEPDVRKLTPYTAMLMFNLAGQEGRVDPKVLYA
jgi:hypothetical protein